MKEEEELPTSLVTTTVPVPEMSSCGGGYMVHGYMQLLLMQAINSYFFDWVGDFCLSSFWVETVTNMGSSSFDASEPPPRGEGFKEVVCKVSGVRDYGCGFVKSEAVLD